MSKGIELVRSLGCRVPQPTARLGRVAVMSFNVNGQAGWYPDEPAKQWARRAPLVAGVIGKYAPAIIGFQEFGVTSWQYAAADAAGQRYAIYLGERAGDIFINPIAYDAERFTATAQLTRWLTRDGRFHKEWGGAERGVSAVLLESRQADSPLWVYNAHLDNKSQPARREGMRVILADVKDRTDGLPVVLMGDFNTATYPLPLAQRQAPAYFDPSLPAVAAADRDMLGMVECAGFTDTNPLRSSFLQPSDPTFHAYLGEGSIREQPDRYGVWVPDGIFVTRHLARAAFQIITDHEGGIYPSDHFPIMAVVGARG